MNGRSPDQCTDLPARMTESELAQHWRVHRRTLQRWRASGSGPAWLRIGSNILYRRVDILAFEAGKLSSSAR